MYNFLFLKLNRNFKHELSPSKPLFRSIQSLILGFSRNQSLAKQWRKFAHFFINFAYAAKYHLTQCSPTKQCAIRSTKQWGKIHSQWVFLSLSAFVFCAWKKTNHQLKKRRTGLPAVARSHLLPWPKFKLSNANELLPSWYLDWN